MAMNARLILDETKYRLFMEQNTGWQNTIKAQVEEIPVMIASTISTIDETEERSQETILCKQLLQQQSDMKKLDEDIESQQKRLAADCSIKNQYDIEAYCMQDILRERIKAIEKAYIDLKCSFLNPWKSIPNEKHP